VALRTDLPALFAVTAETADGTVMAIEHASLPVAAVQFHPESLMTEATGRRIAEAALDRRTREAVPS
jgi:anthranilate synthase